MVAEEDRTADDVLKRVIDYLREQHVPDFPNPDIRAAKPSGFPLRRLAMNRPFQVSAVAVAALIATSLFWMLGAPSSRASFAFGDVKAAVGQTRSVSYRLTTTGWKGSPWPDPYVRTAMVLEPGRGRSETNTGEVQVFNLEEGRLLRVQHRERKAAIYPLYSPSNEAAPSFGDFSQQLRNIPAATTRKIGEREIDGRRVIEFLWRQDDADYVVAVDAATKLPVRMEVNRGKTHRGDEIREVFDDFVFDAEMDESLFSTSPPEGYEVEERVPDASCDSYPVEDAETLILSSAEGMGPIKFEMGAEEVIGLLGQPDWISRTEQFVSSNPVSDGEKTSEDRNSRSIGMLERLDYDSRGFHVTLATRSRADASRTCVTAIRCFNQEISGPMVRDFVGGTKEGIRLGASRENVLETYGKPDMEQDDALDYPDHGWTFTFSNERLCAIALRIVRPPPEGVQTRVLSDGAVLQAVPGVDVDAMIDEDGNLKEGFKRQAVSPLESPTGQDER